MAEYVEEDKKKDRSVDQDVIAFNLYEKERKLLFNKQGHTMGNIKKEMENGTAAIRTELKKENESKRERKETGQTMSDMKMNGDSDRNAGAPRNNRSRSWRGKEKKAKPVKTIETISNKNPVMMLNELFAADKAPIYKVISQEGPPNNPTFKMTCCVDGQIFEGCGKSKKEAKLSCSKEAISQLFGEHINNLSSAALPPQKQQSGGETKCRPAAAGVDLDNWLELEGKNPVSILNELYPSVRFELVSCKGPSHSPEYLMQATLLPHVVTGQGKSKKDAKLNASKALLVKLHQVEFSPVNCSMISGSSETARNNTFGHTWADQIANLVTDKFEEIFGNTTFNKKKVLAGFVVTRGGISSVVCVSTGTKCISGENMSLQGATLNDSHAEILARRSLVYWLYTQLEVACDDEESSIFSLSTEGGFDLKPDVFFDMYISTAPCGDSRLFALHEEASEDQNLLTSPAGEIGEGNRGKLRSKVESGMGTVLLPEGANDVQTWDGIIGGERLLTMSCSDKIMRWNVLGCQGSLLCHWIKPIYLRYITIGSRYHPGHMDRAFYSRIPACLSHATPHFNINRPQILATTSPELRAVWKACDSSVNWIQGTSPEVLNGSTGKQQSGASSRLCKMSLFTKFKEITAREVVKPRLNINKDKLVGKSYLALKQQSTSYQEAKRRLVNALMSSGAGKWIKKPTELETFFKWAGPRIPTARHRNWMQNNNKHNLSFKQTVFDKLKQSWRKYLVIGDKNEMNET